MNMNGTATYNCGPAMINGVMFMINKETFIYAMRLAHDALYLIKKPDDENELNVLMNIISGYVVLLVGFDEDLYKLVYQFLLSNSKFDIEKISLLFDYICDDEELIN